MKISFLIPSLRAGGSERQFLFLGEELAKRGYFVSFITYKSEKSFYRCNDVEAVHIPKKRKIDFAFLNSLVEYVKQNDIDILFSCFEARDIFEPPLFWARLVKLFYPKIEIINGYGGSHMTNSQVIVERLTKNLASLMIANNRYKLGQLRKKAKIDSDRLVFIQNVALTNRFFPLSEDIRQELRLSYLGENKDKFVYGVIGSYTPVKNHILVIQAMEVLKEEDALNDLYFLTYGDESGKNSQFPELKRTIKRKHLENKIALKSTEENVNQLINCLDALIVPSLHEGAPNVVMEALLCKKPIIISHGANRAGFISDGYNGLVFENGDYRQLAECISRMKQNPIRVRESFLKRFRLEHDKEKFIDKHIECFEIVTGEEIKGRVGLA
jgi:glycosyltransferase involved in cell wall biosynthesis